MSTVVANSITGKELFLFADTLVTHQGSAPQGTPIVGVTSHGERFQPIVVNGEALFFSETACKIGSLNDRFAVGMAGDADFCYAILDYLFANRNSLVTNEALSLAFRSSISNMQPSFREFGTRAEFLFCSTDQWIVRAIATVVGNGLIDIMIDSRKVSPDHSYQMVLGSGAQYVSGHLPAEIRRSCAADTSILSICTQMLCMEYSAALRAQTQNQALTVGGAFLGIEISSDGLKIPKDTLYMSSDESHTANYITKVAFDSGLFIITDFLRRTVSVVRTVDEELRYRSSRSIKNTDITSILLRACSFRAPLILFSHFEEDNSHPFTDIVESNSDNAIANGPDEGFAWIEPNQIMSIKSGRGTIDVRIP